MKERKYIKILNSPTFFGIIVGSLAILAQPIFKIQPPQAYGICTVCHSRDLLNWLVRSVFSIKIEVAEVSINGPLLTTVGIFIGAIISSRLHGEYKLIKSENILIMFFLGFAISILSLIILSCPARLVLRFAFSDPFAFLGLIGLLAGIAIGVFFLKWRSRRQCYQ
jgi:uncharacterized protein